MIVSNRCWPTLALRARTSFHFDFLQFAHETVPLDSLRALVVTRPSSPLCFVFFNVRLPIVPSADIEIAVGVFIHLLLSNYTVLRQLENVLFDLWSGLDRLQVGEV